MLFFLFHLRNSTLSLWMRKCISFQCLTLLVDKDLGTRKILSYYFSVSERQKNNKPVANTPCPEEENELISFSHQGYLC